jgi:hypothetical protein
MDELHVSLPRAPRRSACHRRLGLSLESAPAIESGFGLSVVTFEGPDSLQNRKILQSGNSRSVLSFHGLTIANPDELAELPKVKDRERSGIAGAESARVTDLFHRKYCGSRYSLGYSACLSLADRAKQSMQRNQKRSSALYKLSGHLWGPRKNQRKPGTVPEVERLCGPKSESRKDGLRAKGEV